LNGIASSLPEASAKALATPGTRAAGSRGNLASAITCQTGRIAPFQFSRLALRRVEAARQRFDFLAQCAVHRVPELDFRGGAGRAGARHADSEQEVPQHAARSI